MLRLEVQAFQPFIRRFLSCKRIYRAPNQSQLPCNSHFQHLDNPVSQVIPSKVGITIFILRFQINHVGDTAVINAKTPGGQIRSPAAAINNQCMVPSAALISVLPNQIMNAMEQNRHPLIQLTVDAVFRQKLHKQFTKLFFLPYGR